VDFIFLILTTAILYIRPTDFVPGLEAVNLYMIAIVGCILFSLDKLITQLSWDSLRKRPVGVFMAGILGVSILSNLVNGRFEQEVDFAVEYTKVMLFYFLLVGIVNSPARLRRYLVCLIIIDLVPTCLALLHWHGIINIPSFTAMEDGMREGGQLVTIRRRVATGNFGDPNDFCELINPGLLFSVAGLLEPQRRIMRFVWLAPIGIFGQALLLTQSRGGFLGTLTGLLTVFWSRFGRRRALILMALAAPLLFFVAGQRMGAIETSEGTGQSRIQIWTVAIECIKQSPVLGTGINGFNEISGRATHNAYLCSYAELGFLGGTFLFGSYYFTIAALVKLRLASATVRDKEVQRLRPYVLGALISYAVGEFSLTHPYHVPTSAMLGMATACINLGDPEGKIPGSVLTGQRFMHLLRVSALFLIALYVFVKFSVNW